MTLVVGGWLELMSLMVFLNLNDSRVLSCAKIQCSGLEGARLVQNSSVPKKQSQVFSTHTVAEVGELLWCYPCTTLPLARSFIQKVRDLRHVPSTLWKCCLWGNSSEVLCRAAAEPLEVLITIWQLVMQTCMCLPCRHMRL